MSSRTTHLVAGALACLLWSGSIIASKLSYDSLGPMTLGLARFVLATPVFLVLRQVTGEHELPDRRGLVWLAISGIIGITCYFAAENFGALMLPGSTSSLVVGSFPAMTLALECLIDHVRPRPRKLVGVLLAFTGVGVLAFSEGGGGSGSSQLAGVLVLMFAGLCWGIYNFAMRPVLGRYSALTNTYCQTIFGALGFVPCALVEGLPASAPSPTAWASLAYLVLGCTVAGFMLYNWSLEELEASTATSLSNLIPVFGLLLSALILHESIGPAQLLGGAIVLAGVMLSTQDEQGPAS